MQQSSRAHLTKRLRELQAGLVHAFATQRPSSEFSPADADLIDRIAEAIVKRGMAAPAAVFLESMGPVTFLGSQALLVCSPLLELAVDAKDLEQLTRLMERRETVPRLIAAIEAKASSQGAAAQ
jgi:hypothetical protein